MESSIILIRRRNQLVLEATNKANSEFHRPCEVIIPILWNEYDE